MSSVSIEARASLASILSISGGVGMSKSNKELALDFQSKIETHTISIGAAPPEDGKSLKHNVLNHVEVIPNIIVLLR